MKSLEFLKQNKIAHRGIFDNQRIYENTLASYARALKGRFIIEMDVRLLKDGTIICFHDDNLKRLLHIDQETDKLTYEELCYLSKFKIPTLEDALEQINGLVPILIEIRSKYKKGLLESKISTILDKYRGLFAIQSFNIKTLKWFYKNKPNYITGLLICRKNFRKDYFFKKYDFLSINILLFSDKKIRKMREEKFIIGHKICSIQEYNLKNGVYDNLIYDNLLEMMSKE